MKFRYILRVIRSCQTLEQFTSCKNMIDNYSKRHTEAGESMILTEELNYHMQLKGFDPETANMEEYLEETLYKSFSLV
jgi:hypothetical protein